MESPFLIFGGPPAFSDFRRAALAKDIGALDVRASTIHYVALNERAVREHHFTLERLLFGDDFESNVAGQPAVSKRAHVTYYISPRIGTITPWSSKATNIAHVCGYDTIGKRVEGGSIITVTFFGDPPDFPPPFTDKLLDRIIENLSTDPPDLYAMFAE